MWLLALRLVVVPLVVTQLLAAVSGAPRRSVVGQLGIRVLALLVAFLSVTGVASLVVMAPIARLVTVDRQAVSGIVARVATPELADDRAATGPASPGVVAGAFHWLSAVAEAASAHILSLMLAAIVLGWAVSFLAPAHRDPVARRLQDLAHATLCAVAWIPWATPIAVFALVLRMTLAIGTDIVGLLGFYVVIVSGWMLAVTCALYPVSAWLGRTRVRMFARAVASALMVAVSTRSSLMSLPPLVEGGRQHLGFGPTTTGFVLPLCTAVFKMGTVTAEPVCWRRWTRSRILP